MLDESASPRAQASTAAPLPISRWPQPIARRGLQFQLPAVEQGPLNAFLWNAHPSSHLWGFVRGCTAGRHITRMSSLLVETPQASLQMMWDCIELSSERVDHHVLV